MDKTIIIFSELGARILCNPETSEYQGKTYVINEPTPPGVPPHYWKLLDGKIFEMNTLEKAARDGALDGKRAVASNNFTKVDLPPPRADTSRDPYKRKERLMTAAISFGVSLTTSVLIWFLIQLSAHGLHFSF